LFVDDTDANDLDEAGEREGPTGNDARRKNIEVSLGEGKMGCKNEPVGGVERSQSTSSHGVRSNVPLAVPSPPPPPPSRTAPQLPSGVTEDAEEVFHEEV
jgi:hypothetical protein